VNAESLFLVDSCEVSQRWSSVSDCAVVFCVDAGGSGVELMPIFVNNSRFYDHGQAEVTPLNYTCCVTESAAAPNVHLCSLHFKHFFQSLRNAVYLRHRERA